MSYLIVISKQKLLQYNFVKIIFREWKQNLKNKVRIIHKKLLKNKKQSNITVLVLLLNKKLKYYHIKDLYLGFNLPGKYILFK